MVIPIVFALFMVIFEACSLFRNETLLFQTWLGWRYWGGGLGLTARQTPRGQGLMSWSLERT